MKSVREDDITPIELLQMFRRRMPLLLAMLTGSLVIAIIICIVSTRRYEATGTLQIGKEGSDALGLDSLMGGMGGGDAGDSLQANINIETQVQILQSDVLALNTVNSLRLEDTMDFRPTFSLVGWLTGWMAPSGPTDPANAGLEGSPQRRNRVLTLFAKNLTVKSVAGTRLIKVSYLSSDPAVAAEVINSLTQALIDYNFQTRYNATEKASDWLAAQMEGLRHSSEALQAQVVDMQRDSGVYSIGTTDAAGREQAYSGVIDRLQQETVALTASIQNRVLKGAVYEAAKSGDGEMLSGLAGNSLSTGLSAGTSNSLSVIQSLRAQQGTLKAQIQQDQVKYGAAFPKLAEERANVAGLDKEIRDESTRLAERAKSDYDISLGTEAAIRKEYEAQKAAADVVNDKAIKYVITRQEAIDSRSLYEDLLKRLKEAGVLQGLQLTNITVVDKGRIPAKPKWPNIPLYLVAGLGFGTCLGGVLCILVDRLDNKIQEVEEIDMLGFPLFGVVPRFDSADTIDDELQLLNLPRSSYSEAIRNLASSLMLAKSGEHPKTILVTSAIPREGKSTISANLATAFAQQGKTVLLVEADMRRPKIGKMLGVTTADGLSALLSGQSVHTHPIAHPKLSNLSILLVGAIPPYPSELLSSARMKELMREWREDYDIVILDGPPTLPVVDALILCELADSTIQVARHNLTSRTSLKRGHLLLEAHSDRSIGVVLNAVASRSGAYYGYYGYKQEGYYGDNEKHENS